jgi:glutamate--cysteine ligase
MACWLSCDPARTAPPSGYDDDPGAAWAARALRTPLLCVRSDGARWSTPIGVSFADWINGALSSRPTYDDLDYHLSTLFPPVRPRGHLEVRYVDAQPGADWTLPIVVLAAAVATPATLDATLAVCEPALDRWWSAARHGLADPVLAGAAAAVFELACAVAPGLGAPRWVSDRLSEVTTERVQRGRCPADLEDPS